VRDAVDRAANGDRSRFCGPGVAGHGGPHDNICRIAGLRTAVAREFAQATPLAPPTRDERILPPNVRSDLDFENNKNVTFRLEPFAIGSDEQDALGARFRIQAVSGNVYAEAGYRYTVMDGQSRHDVNEAFLHVRGRYGDVIVGRQHLYPGPANNTRVGTLLGLETTDAVVYEAPLKRGFKQQVGYLFDTQALRRAGVKGFYARGLAPLARGNAGYSVLVADEDGTRVGWSLDAAQSVIPNVLDVYGEAGNSARGRDLYTAGFYVPALYHTARLDMFLEYARRGGTQERVSLRLRREMGKGLLLIGFVDRELGSSFFTAGGGVMYSLQFR
jgi:hypothetical protein